MGPAGSPRAIATDRLQAVPRQNHPVQIYWQTNICRWLLRSLSWSWKWMLHKYLNTVGYRPRVSRDGLYEYYNIKLLWLQLHVKICKSNLQCKKRFECIQLWHCIILCYKNFILISNVDRYRTIINILNIFVSILLVWFWQITELKKDLIQSNCIRIYLCEFLMPT